MATNEEKSPGAAFASQLRSNNFFVLHLFGHKYNHAHYEPKFTDIRKQLTLTAVDWNGCVRQFVKGC